jgi:Family of unknown function (DUF5947)
MPSRLAKLAQGPRVRQLAAGPASESEEHCDLCAAPVPPTHRHLVDLKDRRMLCACRACALLFDSAAAGGGHLRLLPTRRRRLDDFVLDDAQWARLRIPVEMAFFFHNTDAERVSAFYPSPAGPTESLLELGAWTELSANNPTLAELEPDVEALLVSRARGMREHWLVPIDDCYDLVGVIRSRWRGFDGGGEVWTEINRFFFDDLPTREQTRW